MGLMFGFVAILLRRSGIVGLGLLMLVENLVPVIPSELILPMAGFEAANGRLEPLGAFLLAT
ncbi:MAG TPA: DedA family protein, partial [Phenylobacterium sp.]|nr:DedA family protein [Phenylobacterium sp.]